MIDLGVAVGALVHLQQDEIIGFDEQVLDAHGEGLHHVCFAVANIEDALGRLPGESGSRVFLGGRGRRACFLTGTANGALIELTEFEPPAGSQT